MRVDFERSRAAVVFPGESGRDGRMRELVEEWDPELLEQLPSILDGEDPFGPVQPSIAGEHVVTVCCSLAYWHALGRPTPRYVVGHSLGELTALAAAGSIAELDAVQLAAARGGLLARACAANPGCGTIAVRAPLFEVEPVAEECGVSVAYHNAPRQVVLSGSAEALSRARDALAERAIRCGDLDNAGAFNSTLMEAAVDPFRELLERCEVSPPQAIVYSATTCRPMIDVRSELASNLVAPVRWWETLARLAMEGVDTFLEVRAGGLLSPLPAGIVSDRPIRPSRTRAARPHDQERTALDEALGAAGTAAADQDSASVDALYVYHDEENRLHLLV